MAHSCSLLFVKQTHQVAMLSAMLLAGGGIVLITTSEDRIYANYLSVTKVSVMCYTRLVLTAHRTLELLIT